MRNDLGYGTADLEQRTAVQRYGLAILSAAIALVVTLTLEEQLARTIFVFFFAAVTVSAFYGGFGPGMLVAVLGAISVTFFIIPPVYAFVVDAASLSQLMSFLGVAGVISYLCHIRIRASRRLYESEQWLSTTIRSIGDAVIATDNQGRVTFMNPVAQSLTGWTEAEASGRKLTEIFNIVNEDTRRPVENPVEKVLQQGITVGLANHTVLIAKDGTEIAIEDSAAPIKGPDSDVAGVIMVFHDVSDRRRMEIAQRFLYESGELLTSSLDYELTLTRVAQQACPHIADWCAVDICEEDGNVQRLAVAHVDPGKVAWAHELRKRYPDDPNSPTGLHAVIRSGKAEFYPDITDEMLQAGARDPEHLKIMRDIGFNSVMIVPLAIHGNVLGAITLVTTTESGRKFTDVELELAEELARKGAMAIENARLFRASQRTAEELRQHATRLDVLADATSAFNQASLDYQVALETVVRRIADLIGDGCAIRLLSEDGQWLELSALYHPDPLTLERLRSVLAARNQRADEGLSGQVLRQGEPALIPMIEPEKIHQVANPDYLPSLESSGVHSIIVLPLRVRGRAIGTLGVVRDSAGRSYTVEDQLLLQDLADRAALVIENARLYHRVDEQREWFEVTLSSIGDAVIATDTEGLVTFMNPIAKELTGWQGSDGMGQKLSTVFNIINENTRLPVESPVDKVLREGKVVGLANHTLLISRNGQEVPIDDSAAPIRDSSGALRGVVMVFHDITERKAIENERTGLFEQVKQQRERLNNLITSVPGVVWEAWGQPDIASQRIDFVSDYVEKMLGYSTDDWLSTPNFWLTIVHPDDQEQAAREAAAIFESRKGGESHFRWVGKDGRVHWIDARSVVIVDDDGNPLGMRGVSMDITEQKEAEDALRESEARFRTMADSAPVLIWVTDVAGASTYVNRTWLEFTGRAQEQELGSRWVEKVHPDDVEPCMDIYTSSFRKREAFRMECRMPHASGDYRWVLASGVPRFTRDQSFAGYIGSIIDIDDRKKIEIQLIEAMDSAIAANSAKDQFLAVLSHELRTPLTPVLATAQALESDPDMPEDFRPLIEIIRRNVELEAHLIDDLLDLVRVAKGKLQLSSEDVDLHLLLENVLQICGDEIREKDLQLTMDLHAGKHHMKGDPARLQQIFWNLLKNAVKFTPAGGSVTIRTFNPEADVVDVEVSDTGIGIEPEVLPRIFNAFEQGEQGIARRFGGLGLGLAISKGLVEQHGGLLVARSEGKNRGTTFTVRFQTVAVEEHPAVPQAPEQPAAGNGAQSSGRIRILIVDDHEDTNNVMKLLLERHGYEVAAATSMRGALEVAARFEFDLLVSDIGLPDGSGHDLVRTLSQTRPIKAIALSGFGMDGDIRRSREAGFSEHLTKPVTFHKLQAAIEGLIHGAA